MALQDLSGIVLLNKPRGLSSNAALQKVKRAFSARKAGHTGTLDPLASGLLIICLGRATKFCQYLLDADKQYDVVAKLGEKTTTSDSEGDIIERKPVPDFSDDDIEQVLAKFRGDTSQVPSMYSALKHQGEPLYKLARRGEVVERKERAITIHSLNCIARDSETLTLSVHCSKGTYVRTLVEDIGDTLGCLAHVQELKRTKISGMDVQASIELDELLALDDEERMAYCLPIDTMLQHLPKIACNTASTRHLCTGQSLVRDDFSITGLTRLYNEDKDFFGIGDVQHGTLKPKKLFI